MMVMMSVIQNDVFVVRDMDDVVTLFYEYRERGRVYYSDRKGNVKGWRRRVFLYAMDVFKAKKEEREFIPGVKMSILIRTLPVMKDRSSAFELVDIIDGMGIEELSFWTWKLNQLKRKAAMAIKAMYGVR